MEIEDFSYDNGKLICKEKGAAEEIEEIIEKMDIETKSGKAFNEYFKEKLREREWNHRGKVISPLPIKYGFRKNKIEIETQFGNVARYYSDVFKLQLSFDREKIEGGVLILPTKLLANQIGSNIASFERAKEELRVSRPLYSVPIWLIGVKVKI